MDVVTGFNSIWHDICWDGDCERLVHFLASVEKLLVADDIEPIAVGGIGEDGARWNCISGIEGFAAILNAVAGRCK